MSADAFKPIAHLVRTPEARFMVEIAPGEWADFWLEPDGLHVKRKFHVEMVKNWLDVLAHAEGQLTFNLL